MSLKPQIRAARQKLKKLLLKQEHLEAHRGIKQEIRDEQTRLHRMCLQCLDEEENEMMIERDLRRTWGVALSRL